VGPGIDTMLQATPTVMAMASCCNAENSEACIYHYQDASFLFPYLLFNWLNNVPICSAGLAPAVANHLAIKGERKFLGVWINAVPDLIVGDVKTWAEKASVDSVKIPGYWSHRNPKAGIVKGSAAVPGEKVILSFHGGAYTMFSAHPEDPTYNILKGILAMAPDSVHRAFAPEYRLAGGHEDAALHCFPTQLIDAIAGYTYLVKDVGFSPRDIIIEGDSAGGNLAQALTRYLVEYGNDLPTPLLPPGGLLLISPWADLTINKWNFSEPPTAEASVRFQSDWVDPDWGDDSSIVFAGVHGRGLWADNRYVSPASKHINPSFEGFPRTLITAGGGELMLDQIRVLRDRMFQQLGEVKGEEGKVSYLETPDAWHDHISFPQYEPERSEALRVITTWIASL